MDLIEITVPSSLAKYLATYGENHLNK